MRNRSESLPGLDQNCANEEVFIEAQREVMGEWRSAPMVAFGTMRRLSAWKMYCRAANVPFGIANTISDQLRNYELAIKHATDDEKDPIALGDYVSPEYIDLARKSEQYLGMIEASPLTPALICFVQLISGARSELSG